MVPKWGEVVVRKDRGEGVVVPTPGAVSISLCLHTRRPEKKGKNTREVRYE